MTCTRMCRPRHDTVDIDDRHRNVTAHNTYARYVILLTFTFRVFYAENMAFFVNLFARLVSLLLCTIHMNQYLASFRNTSACNIWYIAIYALYKFMAYVVSHLVSSTWQINRKKDNGVINTSPTTAIVLLSQYDTWAPRISTTQCNAVRLVYI